MEITLEMLHAQQETLRGLLSTVVDILSNDKRNLRKKKDDTDPILSLPPISNEKAAALLGISTRQLQRIRKTYNRGLKEVEKSSIIWGHSSTQSTSTSFRGIQLCLTKSKYHSTNDLYLDENGGIQDTCPAYP